MIGSFPEVSAFSEIKKASRRLLSASVHLRCLQCEIIFIVTLNVQVGTHASHPNDHNTLLAGITVASLASHLYFLPAAARRKHLKLKSDNTPLVL